MSRISGTTNDGTWQATVTIPAGRPSEYFEFFSIVIKDVVGNQLSFLRPLGPDITLTNSNVDASPLWWGPSRWLRHRLT